MYHIAGLPITLARQIPVLAATGWGLVLPVFLEEKPVATNEKGHSILASGQRPSLTFQLFKETARHICRY